LKLFKLFREVKVPKN